MAGLAAGSTRARITRTGLHRFGRMPTPFCQGPVLQLMPVCPKLGLNRPVIWWMSVETIGSHDEQCLLLFGQGAASAFGDVMHQHGDCGTVADFRRSSVLHDKIDGVAVLRVAIVNHRTTKQDVEIAVAATEREAALLLQT